MRNWLFRILFFAFAIISILKLYQYFQFHQRMTKIEFALFDQFGNNANQEIQKNTFTYTMIENSPKGGRKYYSSVYYPTISNINWFSGNFKIYTLKEFSNDSIVYELKLDSNMIDRLTFIYQKTEPNKLINIKSINSKIEKIGEEFSLKIKI